MNAKPTNADVKAYRDLQGGSMQDAYDALTRKWRTAELRRLRHASSDAHTTEACRAVLAELLDFLAETI